jgi:hypothetical protein
MTDSPRLSTRAVAASAVALLLAGPAAGAALADDGGKGGKGGRSGDHRQDGGRQDATARSASGSGGAGGASTASGGSSARQGSPNPRVTRTGQTEDPAGNNGTFKVDGLAYDDGLGNEPHVSCGFRLKFYGFDEGQTGDITIDGQAPSGSGVVSERTGVLLSDDAAGGGPNDVDAVVEYTLDDLDLSGLTAHPQQGYHVKVTLSTDTPGGVKHKVFWIEPCVTEAPPAVGGTGTPTVGGTGTDAGGATEEDRAVVLGTTLTRTDERAGASVLGTSLTRGPLAFTGSVADWLLALGGGLVAAGAGLVAATRRPRGGHAR